MLGIRVLVGCAACLPVPQHERPEFTLGQKNSSVSWSGLCVYDHVFLLPIVIYSVTAWGRIYQYADGGSLPHTSFNTFYSFSMQHTGALFRGIPVYFFFSLDWDVSLTRRRVWWGRQLAPRLSSSNTLSMWEPLYVDRSLKHSSGCW